MRGVAKLLKFARIPLEGDAKPLTHPTLSIDQNMIASANCRKLNRRSGIGLEFPPFDERSDKFD